MLAGRVHLGHLRRQRHLHLRLFACGRSRGDVGNRTHDALPETQADLIGPWLTVSYKVTLAARLFRFGLFVKKEADQTLAQGRIGESAGERGERPKLQPAGALGGGGLDGLLQGGSSGHGGIEYQNYYQAQAFFQGDIELWRKWNKDLVRRLKSTQKEDGSVEASQGIYVGTTLSLLALAVNYRFLPIYER